MHVNPSLNCKTCAEKIEGCHNSLRLWFEIISDNFKDCHVAVGFRGEADQEAAVAAGLSHAVWGKSKHNYMEDGKPSSWAIDIFQLGEDGKAHFEPSYFENIWGFIKKLQDDAGDQDLTWGGLFHTLKDLDHFEMIKAEVIKQIQDLASGGC